MTGKRLVFAAFVCFLVIAPFHPQSAVPAKDPADRLAELPAFIEAMRAEWNVPAVALAVVSGDQVVLAAGYGFRDVERKLPASADTIFAIGSCTKAFTATGLAILADEGKLDWDKPVRSVLPEFALADPLASERMTPRDLLCHRSGLPRHDMIWYSSKFGREDLLARLRHLEPSKDFRQAYQYQNLMFMTAGVLAERLAGMSWESFTRERILKPLGMSRTNFSVNDSQRAVDHALPYAEIHEKVGRIPFHNIDPIGPAGSMNSSARDMSRWIRMNLGRGKYGENTVVSSAQLELLQAPHMVNTQTLRYEELLYASYGQGWGVNSYRGHLLVSHGGAIDGFQAIVSLLPREGMGLVVLTNLAGNPLPTILSYAVWDRLLGLEPVDWSGRIKEERAKAEQESEKKKAEEAAGRKMNTRPSHDLEDYAGTYLHPGYGRIVVQKSGRELTGRFNEMAFGLSHFHYDVFRAVDEYREIDLLVSFHVDTGGRIASLSVPFEPAVKPIVFLRAPEVKSKDSSPSRRGWGGVGRSDHDRTKRIKPGRDEGRPHGLRPGGGACH